MIPFQTRTLTIRMHLWMLSPNHRLRDGSPQQTLNIRVSQLAPWASLLPLRQWETPSLHQRASHISHQDRHGQINMHRRRCMKLGDIETCETCAA